MASQRTLKSKSEQAFISNWPSALCPLPVEGSNCTRSSLEKPKIAKILPLQALFCIVGSSISSKNVGRKWGRGIRETQWSYWVSVTTDGENKNIYQIKMKTIKRIKPCIRCRS
jgi:hypothetical protein